MENDIRTKGAESIHGPCPDCGQPDAIETALVKTREYSDGKITEQWFCGIVRDSVLCGRMLGFEIEREPTAADGLRELIGSSEASTGVPIEQNEGNNVAIDLIKRKVVRLAWPDDLDAGRRRFLADALSTAGASEVLLLLLSAIKESGS